MEKNCTLFFLMSKWIIKLSQEVQTQYKSRASPLFYKCAALQNFLSWEKMKFWPTPLSLRTGLSKWCQEPRIIGRNIFERWVAKHMLHSVVEYGRHRTNSPHPNPGPLLSGCEIFGNSLLSLNWSLFISILYES